MQHTDRYATLARRLGGHLISTSPLDGGVSAESVLLTYEVGTERRRVIVRAASRFSDDASTHAELTRMATLLAALHEAELPVGRPLLLDDEGPAVDDPRLVLEFISGTTDLPDLHVALPALARLLHQVHAVPADRLERIGLPEAIDPVGEARDILVQLRPELDLDLLIQDPQPRDDLPVLVHGDLWPNNVIWRDEQVVGLIDWEDAAVGDPERDLATARTELTLAVGAAAAAEFRRHYDAASPHLVDQHRVDLWTVCSAGGMLLYVGNWGVSAEREARVRAAAREVLDETLARLVTRHA